MHDEGGGGSRGRRYLSRHCLVSMGGKVWLSTGTYSSGEAANAQS